LSEHTITPIVHAFQIVSLAVMSNQKVDCLWDVSKKKLYQERTMNILKPELLIIVSDLVASQPLFPR
jgi:hypothetical protein